MNEQQIVEALQRGDAKTLADEVRRLQAALYQAYRENQGATSRAYLDGVAWMRKQALEAVNGVNP